MPCLIAAARHVGIWVFVLLAAAGAAHAQNATVDVLNYARTAPLDQRNAVDIRVDGTLVKSGLVFASGSQLSIAAGTSLSLEITRTDDPTTIATQSLSLVAGNRYLLLLSGDGSVQPFAVRLDSFASARRIRLFNAALLPGDATATEVRLESTEALGYVAAAHGQLSATIGPDGFEQKLHFRRAADAAILVDLKRRDYGRSGQRENLLVLHGAPGALKVDEVQFFSALANVDPDLPQLVLGSFELRFLNGGAYDVEAGPMLMSLSGVAGHDVAYGDFSPTIAVPQQGAWRMCAYVRLFGQPNSDYSACATLDLDGGQRYIAVSRAYTPNATPPRNFDIDYLPFVVYRQATANAGAALVRMHYAAVAPRGGETLSIRRDDGSDARPLESPQDMQPDRGSGPGSTTVLSGAPVAVDVKLTSADGQRNLADLAPFTPVAGNAVDVFLVGDGKTYPYRLANLANVPNEGVVDLGTAGLWTIDGVAAEGFNLTPMPSQDRLLGTWFSHDGGQQRWFALDSCRADPGSPTCPAVASFDNRRVRLRAYTTLGAAQGRGVVDAGLIDIEFRDCRNAAATVNLLGQSERLLTLVNQTPNRDCPQAGR